MGTRPARGPRQFGAATRQVALEPVEAGQSYAILVDYAHTEDALERLLSAVRELTDKTIILVFGCGGDRDKGKRFPMGLIAGRMADIPIATSDNPRSEDPDAILAEVEKGLAASGATKYLKIADRREAIRTATGAIGSSPRTSPRLRICRHRWMRA